MNNTTDHSDILLNSYYPILVTLFCTVVLLGNIFALKTSSIFGLISPCGMICFPFTFTICDIVTEVYGDKAARQTIRLGLITLLIYFCFLSIVTSLTPAPSWNKQEEWETIFAMSKLIFIATFTAYYLGERINSFLLSTLKYICNKKYFLKRSLISTFFGVCVDTFIFNFIAFFWFFSFDIWISITISQLILKLLYEVLGSFIASAIVPYLKKNEKLDPLTERAWINKYLLNK